jgi:hypothetical protein
MSINELARLFFRSNKTVSPQTPLTTPYLNLTISEKSNAWNIAALSAAKRSENRLSSETVKFYVLLDPDPPSFPERSQDQTNVWNTKALSAARRQRAA